ncbi:hypothetical protein [Aquibacillus albus]|uniref:DUF2812 domain-containing protein n=1 Tax=Aquibacillus albus TaxID=1168171 RepID=A0ABS2MZZ4_9BACI|nr:hypothetical protein [Aquibacillus albus]MBM7571483.1 hypothetical protein [Aquibacillus albus]
MKQSFLDQFYTVDPVSGDYIIEIALKDYDEVFNTWDSSVYNIRDLDSSLKSFLEEFSYEIDSRNKIKLIFVMQDEKKDNKMEKSIETGVRNYFNYRYFLITKQTKKNRKKSVIYILISMMFTIVSTYFQVSEENKLIQELISLNLTVGGWVFLWEAFSLLFMQSGNLSKRRKHYKRIVSAPIVFRYH